MKSVSWSDISLAGIASEPAPERPPVVTITPTQDTDHRQAVFARLITDTESRARRAADYIPEGFPLALEVALQDLRDRGADVRYSIDEVCYFSKVAPIASPRVLSRLRALVIERNRKVLKMSRVSCR